MPDCFLTIWKPSDEILEMLNEGNLLRIYHLTASPNRFQNTSSSAQLSTTRITKFIPITTYRVAIERLYIERQVYQVGNVKSKFTSMPFDEFDCVGIVVYVDFNCESALTRLVDSVYLADKDCNLLCIRFVNGLKHYAVDDLLTVGMAVSICNLQTKPRMSLAVPIATATELTKVSQNLDKDTGSAFEILLNNLPDKQWLLSKTMDMIRSLRIQENNLNFANEGLALQTKNKPPASAKKKKAHRQIPLQSSNQQDFQLRLRHYFRVLSDMYK
ncbi:uncharacterized protein TRIADDRAFT_59113 [Trichoplax adhaerens]|uniref:BRCA2 OB3 domain-containing protein n=1 Tax=Trichoplax adhaerens TaxID=10228 RepID=B3S4K0_TRIAD|nr:hypothetical protein TRIADDRAFT_59113 [Trichoplax adhaerens]EDV22646.1 hypothetical protein TRIADDRAFT_59113 [Trichoplax adhaerens]|eukprot:XP_002115190.1 hypothetical protein TRIADDRAFT_59113 [Trichoplax adhaerens]